MSIAEKFSFRDERFVSSAEKHLILNAWVTFLRHGCRPEHFTERLYDHLYLHCSFIAHFNRNGFYDFYFATPGEQTHRFLDQFDPNKPGITAELGGTHWLMSHAAGSDLSHAMRDVAAPFIARLRLQLSEVERQSDLMLASRLAEKHGKHLSECHASLQTDTNSWVLADAALNEDAKGEQLSMFNPDD